MVWDRFLKCDTLPMLLGVLRRGQDLHYLSRVLWSGQTVNTVLYADEEMRYLRTERFLGINLRQNDVS